MNIRPEIDKCYRRISDLPEETDGLLCVVKPVVTEKLVQEAEERGIRRIWMQQGAESKEAMEFCEAQSLSMVSKTCILMYADPVLSFHKFHRGLAKLLGRYHKPVDNA